MANTYDNTDWSTDSLTKATATSSTINNVTLDGTLTVSGTLTAPNLTGNVAIAGRLVEGRTVIKIPPTAFTSNDDYSTGLNLAVLEDDSSVYGIRTGSTNIELYAYIDVPLGYTATKVRINGSDDDMNVEVYTLDLDAGTISSEISNSGLQTNDDTALSSNHVGADDKMLFIKVETTATTDIVWGGYVTIEVT